jgi:hypothetical protein
MLKPITLKSDLAQTENTGPLSVIKDAPEALFEKGPHGRSLSRGKLLCFLKQAIWNLYGCFHTFLCTIEYIDMSMKDSGI